MSSGERFATLSPDAADGVLLVAARSRSWGARLAWRTRFGRPLYVSSACAAVPSSPNGAAGGNDGSAGGKAVSALGYGALADGKAGPSAYEGWACGYGGSAGGSGACGGGKGSPGGGKADESWVYGR